MRCGAASLFRTAELAWRAAGCPPGFPVPARRPGSWRSPRWWSRSCSGSAPGRDADHAGAGRGDHRAQVEVVSSRRAVVYPGLRWRQDLSEQPVAGRSPGLDAGFRTRAGLRRDGRRIFTGAAAAERLGCWGGHGTVAAAGTGRRRAPRAAACVPGGGCRTDRGQAVAAAAARPPGCGCGWPAVRVRVVADV